MAIDILTRLQTYAEQPIFAERDWSQLYSPSTFQWQHGVTPGSHVVVVLALLVGYVALSFTFQALMRLRGRRFEGNTFTSLVVLHNDILSIGSLVMMLGLLRSVYLFARRYYANDTVLEAYMCDSQGHYGKNNPESNEINWWLYVFYLSKFYEMIDTYILAFKCKPLTFLQMYHHSSIVFLCWSWLEARWSLAWYGMFFNTLVHTFMYYYFKCQAKGIRVWWKQWLTTGQLTQFSTVFGLIFVWMAVSLKGLSISAEAPFVHYTSSNCTGEPWAVFFSQSINVSYLYLFGSLFVTLYMKPKKTSKKQK
eukprot:TRINITY_DN6015_c0_g1_i1.p1 TRINITY_DN6015_c0_g1~~TRINITY_DN6015_c0_g1_i1.p1  ORF type:complete len:327 (+),score=64.22 TRINITY_DN6015_c0_g1_i1:59-982(+)